MFSGIVQSLGTVVDVQRGSEKARFKIASPDFKSYELGESIAVNGVCLTVAEWSGNVFAVDLTTETLRRTSFGSVHRRMRVNLERSLTPSGKISGHFVSGHVDQVGTVRKIENLPGEYMLWFDYPCELDPYIIEKGSIAVDGISLTVVSSESGRFSVSIIPFTWSHTNLNERKDGDPVNIECDMIGKYIVKTCHTLLGGGEQKGSGLALDLLKQRGFINGK